MSSLHPARRRAERFHSLTEGGHGAADGRDADLLELVGALQSLPRVEARPEFVSDLRERLMLAAETDLVATDGDRSTDAVTERLTVRTRRTPRERRLAVALGGLAIVGATTSMAVAAQSALPGDVLYPLKRAIENAEAGFSVSDESKGQTILDNATGRLDEVDRLARRDDADVRDVTQTLDAFAAQASEASELLMADYQSTGSEASITELRTFNASSIAALVDLEDVIPAGAQAALLGAAQTLFDIDQTVTDLCPACEGPLLDGTLLSLLSAGGDPADAAEATQPATVTPETGKPAQGKDKPASEGGGPAPVSGTDLPDDPIQLPNPEPPAGGAGTGQGTQGGQGTKNPGSGGVSVPTAVPSLGIPVVDEVVEEVVEGVDEVLGGVTGGLTGGNTAK